MADNTNVEVLTIKIGGVDTEIDSLKKLKQARKDLQSEFLAGNADAAKSLGVLNEKYEDLNDSVRATKGVGLEQATSSFQLLGESVKNLDFDKFKTALGGLKGALASTGILLLVQGVTYLIENFDELSKGTGVLATILQYVGKVIKDVSEAFTDLIGVTSDATRALDAMGEALTKNAKTLQGAMDAQAAAFDRQIAVAKSAGKQTVDLEVEKQQAIIKTSTYLNLQADDFIKAGGKLNDAQFAVYEKNRQNVINANAQIDIILNNSYKAREDEYKKHLAELKKLKDEHDAKLKVSFDASLADENASIDSDLKTRDEKYKQYEADRAAGIKLISDLEKKANDEATKLNADRIAKTKAQDIALEQGKASLAKNSFSVLQSLSSAFFANELAGAEGNAKEQAKIKETQFNVEKGLKIANIAIDTASNVVKTTAELGVIGALTPPGIALIAGIIALGTAQAAIVAATKFNSGSVAAQVSAPGSSASGSFAAPPPPPPQINTVNQGPNTTYINGPATGQIYMVETQSSRVTNGVIRIETQAKYP